MLFGMCLHPSSQSDLCLRRLLLPLSPPFSFFHAVQRAQYILMLQRGDLAPFGAVNSITSKQLQYIHGVR